MDAHDRRIVAPARPSIQAILPRVVLFLPQSLLLRGDEVINRRTFWGGSWPTFWARFPRAEH